MKYIILLLVIAISGCGMQGDLYLPEDKPAKQKDSFSNSN